MVRQSYTRANELFKKACELKLGNGCFNLGVNYENGYGVQKSKESRANAKEYYGKACDLGFAKGCEKYSELNLNVKFNYPFISFS